MIYIITVPKVNFELLYIQAFSWHVLHFERALDIDYNVELIFIHVKQ